MKKDFRRNANNSWRCLVYYHTVQAVSFAVTAIALEENAFFYSCLSVKKAGQRVKSAFTVLLSKTVRCCEE